MRRVSLIALAVVVPGLIAVNAWLFNSANVRAMLQDAATRAAGRPVVIDGPITVTWRSRLRIEGLRLLAPPGLSRPELARVGSAEIGVAWLSLLSGRIELRGVQLDTVDVLLERDGTGRGNWERPPASAPTGQPGTASAPGRRMEVSLDSAIITHATLAYRDAGRTWTAQMPRGAIEDGRRVAADLVLDGVPVRVTGTGPFPWALQVTADRVPVGAMAADAVRLTLTADGPDTPVRLDGTGTVGGVPATLAATAPSLRSVAADGVLDRISLALGDATAVAEGRLDLRRPDIAVRAHVPSVATLGAALGLVWPDWHGGEATVKLTRTSTGASMVGTAVLAGSDVAFRLGVGWPRWQLDGTIDAGVLDLDPLLIRPAAPVAASEALVTGPAVSGPVPPVTAAPPRPLPFSALTEADGDVRLTAGTLRWRKTDFTSLTAHAVLEHGTLIIDGAHAMLGGGPVDAHLVAGATPPHASLTLEAPGSDAAAIEQLAGVAPAVTGRAELDVSLDGTGPDWPSLLASATGRVGLAMVGGEADLAAIPGLTAGLAQISRGTPLPAKGAVPGRTPIRCLALRADLADGHATLAALVLDTPRLTSTGEGIVDMADRTLALRLRPSVAVGSVTVSSPLRVTGPWAKPAVKMDGDGGRAGISIATVSEPDQCGPALTLARNGRPGAMPPAPEPPKSTKPADLLRSLLR